MHEMPTDRCLATCHCGAVQLSLASSPTKITECNCSICRRIGAWWTYYQPSEVRLLSGSEVLGSYCWQDKKIAFHHCLICGSTTHYSTTSRAEQDRVAVNARMIPAEKLDGIPRRLFDGAKTWRYLCD